MRQNATRTNSSTPPEDVLALYKRGGSGKQKSADKKHKGESKLQIGKRFLKGEIGIKSFNYYLIKEGLKSSTSSSKKSSGKGKGGAKGISKSEENIYEEIYFTDKPASPAAPLEHHYEPLKQQPPEQMYAAAILQKQHTDDGIKYLDCALCVEQCTDKNCEICINQQHSHQDYSGNYSNYVQTYALLRENEKNQFNSYHQQQQQQHQQPPQPVLQYQSYNPSNPNVYKIETTPVAFPSDYQPVSYVEIQQPSSFYYPPPPPTTAQQMQGSMTFNPVYGYETIRHGKSSSSTDSLQHHQVGGVFKN